jgi:hypothetical protein
MTPQYVSGPQFLYLGPKENLVSLISLQTAHADISPAHGVLIPVRKNKELGSRHSYYMLDPLSADGSGTFCRYGLFQ